MVNRGCAGDRARGRRISFARWAARLLIMSLIFSAESAFTKTWHVEKDGTGDFAIIQAALNWCAPGDTVLVGPGRYDYHAPFDFGALTEDTYAVVDVPNVTLRGTDRDAVIIGPEVFTKINSREPNGVATSSNAGGFRLENLTVENVVEGVTILVQADATDCVVRDCESGAVVFSDEVNTFTRCEFLDCPDHSLACYLQGNRVVLDHCHFEAYVPFPGAQSPGGVVISQAHNVLVTDCSFQGDAFLNFQMFADGTIQNSTFDSGGIGLLDGSAHIEGNIMGHTPLSNVLANGYGVVTGSRNVFGGGEDGTLYLSTNSVELHDNHILNGGGYTVKINSYDSPDSTLDLTNNWWGTADSTQIATWIRDVHDDPKYNIEVKFAPFADQPL
ncbi:MAG TPA: right-handed parallel beta-helix repeat-containing protein, partial [Candidatus Krumholzibacteria bacterium]|nr:right-handed parallel beta-helix repeat-containing protein [Candidatus Krumholzibacteria bacterium]